MMSLLLTTEQQTSAPLSATWPGIPTAVASLCNSQLGPPARSRHIETSVDPCFMYIRSMASGENGPSAGIAEICRIPLPIGSSRVCLKSAKTILVHLNQPAQLRAFTQAQPSGRQADCRMALTGKNCVRPLNTIGRSRAMKQGDRHGESKKEKGDSAWSANGMERPE